MTLLALMGVLISGCGRVDGADPATKVRIEGRTGYGETICDIPLESDGSFDDLRTIESVYRNDRGVYCVVKNTDINNGMVKSVILYEISADGDVVSKVNLDAAGAAKFTMNAEEVISFSPGEIGFYSVEDGNRIGSVQSEEVPIATSGYGDGFVACFRDKVIKYDADGNETGRIENSEFGFFSDYCDPVFEQGGKTYLVSSPGFEYRYYESDFDSGYCNYLGSNQDYGIGFQYCCGEYIFDETGEYRLDPETGEMVLLGEWNNINRRPGGANVKGYRFYHAFGDDCFVESYIDGNNTACIQIYDYDNSIDYSGAKKITVGGDALDTQEVLLDAVYRFNTSQDEYRVELMEFGGAGGGNEEEIRRNADLISEFQSGNSPDIFYGNLFDYEYFGRNGLVIDMLPYLERSDSFDIDDMEDSLWTLMSRDGHCYQLFCSYWFNGFFGHEDDWGEYTDMSFGQFAELAGMTEQPSSDMASGESGSGVGLFGSFYSCDLAAIALNDPLPNLIEDGRLSITEDQVLEIVDFSLKYGFPDSTDFSLMMHAGPDSLRTGEVRLSWGQVNGLLMYNEAARSAGGNLAYVGSPSVYGAAHKIRPWGNTAVSSNSLYPQACVEFLTYMFDAEAQRRLIVSNFPSVLESVNEEFFGYCLNPDSIPLDNISYRRMLSGGDSHFSSVTPESVEAYRRLIDSADTLEIYDWTVYELIKEEIASHELQGKPAEDIAESLCSRLSLYVDEYYG